MNEKIYSYRIDGIEFDDTHILLLKDRGYDPFSIEYYVEENYIIIYFENEISNVEMIKNILLEG